MSFTSVPVIALIGRPNVGKSTLFNALVGQRQALVFDQPGTTRDRIYGRIFIKNRPMILIDTGGLDAGAEGLALHMRSQTLQAIEEADYLFFLVDGRVGLTAQDEVIAKALRRTQKPTAVLVNKTEALDTRCAEADFHRLGFAPVLSIAAAHRQGIDEVLNQLLRPLLKDISTEKTPENSGIKIAVIGRPNVGKSTLVNRMIGEERTLVYDEPGTTRDSIHIPFSHRGSPYTLIDTAGIRRKGKVHETLEKFSVVKTLQAIEEAQVVIPVLDATEAITDQDLHVIGFALEAGKAMVLAINKWDGLAEDKREWIKKEIDRRLVFLTDFVDIHFISALQGTGVESLYRSINTGYRAATCTLSTPKLTEALQRAVFEHNPPMMGGRRVKLRYAHLGGHCPPVIVIHGNQAEKLPDSYRQYLVRTFRNIFKLRGTPLQIVLKTSANPYAPKGSKN